jgi:hypothetical protein
MARSWRDFKEKRKRIPPSGADAASSFLGSPVFVDEASGLV